MHAPGFPALSTVALAARLPRLTPTATRAARAATLTRQLRQRTFHTSPTSLSSDPSTPAKPATETVVEQEVQQDVDVEEPQTAETTSDRRKKTDGKTRNRRAARSEYSDLPPTVLPYSWRRSNITHYDSKGQPRLPPALVEDATHDKVSRLFPKPKDTKSKSKSKDASDKANATIESYFDTALNMLLAQENAMAMDFMDRPQNGPSEWNTPKQIEQAVRTWDMIIDASWHLTDALYPARQPEYIYKVRPFWWWHFYKDLDPKTQKFRDLHIDRSTPIGVQIGYATMLQVPLSHATADFPPETLHEVSKAVGRDLKTSAPPNFDSKTGKRPINIISTSGYSGKAIAESLGQHMGWLNEADVIHLDAFDLSVLIGEYIGQDWAFSRGSASMMGFRAGELNGKIEREPERDLDLDESKDDDEDGNIISVRTGNSAYSLDLSKIRRAMRGDSGVFNKWDTQKINKILDHIIQANSRPEDDIALKPTLIHIHDYVELNMTLEGSYILSRLRSLVDAAWQTGRHIAILGTSSCTNPSEAYHSTIQELAQTDFVVTRHIQPDRVEEQTTVSPKNSAKGSQIPFNLERVDTFLQNGANINRMLAAIDPEKFTDDDWTPLHENLNFQLLANVAGTKNMLRQSILPLPEVYHLAGAVRQGEYAEPGAGAPYLLNRFMMGPLRQPPGQDFLEESHFENVVPNLKTEPAQEKNVLKLATLNEYEKRIATGHINKDNLRTSFSDIHATPETINALKLLTSLALIRPDAFSYGVLAHDKITGCLLYGPPGTGKTMLAKAVAKESGAHMLEISGASINDKWVGETEKLIRAVFTLAKKLSPCVVFIDEADALLANRSNGGLRSSHREQINQFLKEWDGMEETNAFIMVATNRPFDLDDAVLRRLPRKLLVDLPLKEDRAAILRLLLRDEVLGEGVDLEGYAERTAYYSGSDLKSVCVAAAMACVEEENLAASLATSTTSTTSTSSSETSDRPSEYKFPERRTLRKEHFERALKQIPASISEDMPSLRMIRRFDEEYGNAAHKGRKKKGFGFGEGAKGKGDAEVARVRA